MEAPRLNDDTLLQVMRFAFPHTLFKLTQTYRLFHRAGAEYILQDEVTLSNERQFDSLVRFMIADGGYRLPHLRFLSIGNPTESSCLSSSAAHALAVLFYHLAQDGALCNIGLRSAEDFLRSELERG
ncbi:hypothetical protein OH77DRAFT_529288 [Trametes cingulata]|nr:hypothetical protein OH77DRAFT_529288 [Trametes cingulata]